MLFFLIFFLLWMLFNGRVTWDVIGFGVVFSAAVAVFALKVCGWSRERSKKAAKILGSLLAYFGCLVVEIIKANLAAIKVILSPGCRLAEPQIFRFDSGLKRGFTQTILANSITITPGTYTVSIDDGIFTVHALNTEFAEGTRGSDLNRRRPALRSIRKEMHLPLRGECIDF